MLNRNQLTQKTAKELLSYDPVSGDLFWNPRTEKNINKSALKSWNTKYAGKRIGTKDGKGYLHLSFQGKFYRAHRIVWLICKGTMPNVIDHVNGVRTDNRIINIKNTLSKVIT